MFGGDLRLLGDEEDAFGPWLVSADATRLAAVAAGEDEKSVGEGLVETRFSAPFESILMGESCFRGGDLLPPALPLKEGVIEMLGADDALTGSVTSFEPAAEFFFELVRMAAAAALTAAAFEESCSSLNLACHSRA